jgi:hypothetical protein
MVGNDKESRGEEVMRSKAKGREGKRRREGEEKGKRRGREGEEKGKRTGGWSKNF